MFKYKYLIFLSNIVLGKILCNAYLQFKQVDEFIPTKF